MCSLPQKRELLTYPPLPFPHPFPLGSPFSHHAVLLNLFWTTDPLENVTSRDLSRKTRESGQDRELVAHNPPRPPGQLGRRSLTTSGHKLLPRNVQNTGPTLSGAGGGWERREGKSKGLCSWVEDRPMCLRPGRPSLRQESGVEGRVWGGNGGMDVLMVRGWICGPRSWPEDGCIFPFLSVMQVGHPAPGGRLDASLCAPVLCP